ncbi:MAG TPA: hypothetical protein ENJ29_10410 [Bacteroidetes bacterium]|nr:hypothetical protein [Bacteroidota bacterium]
MSLKKILILLAAILLSSCEKNSVSVIANGQYKVKEPSGDFSHIADPVLRWRAYGLRDYVLEQSRMCFCIDAGKRRYLIVSNEKLVDVIDVESGESLPAEQHAWYDTVDELFALAAKIDTSEVASSEIIYDPRFGFPVRIAVDWDAGIADEEVTILSTNLKQLVSGKVLAAGMPVSEK